MSSRVVQEARRLASNVSGSKRMRNMLKLGLGAAGAAIVGGLLHITWLLTAGVVTLLGVLLLLPWLKQSPEV